MAKGIPRNLLALPDTAPTKVPWSSVTVGPSRLRGEGDGAASDKEEKAAARTRWASILVSPDSGPGDSERDRLFIRTYDTRCCAA